MSSSDVSVELRGDIAWISLDAVAKRNALSQRLLAAFHDALDEAERGSARVIVIGHAPPVFCAGADLGERAAGISSSEAMGRLFERLMASEVPTIAAVQGPVRAGGMGVMTACDLVVVQRDVTFAFTEVRLGVVPAMIAIPVLRRSTWSAMVAPFLTGEQFDAEDALRRGLVTHVTDDVPATVHRLVDGVLSGGPRAVAITKQLFHEPLEMEAMRTLSDELFASEEAAEGMSAFAERRRPSWAP